MFLQLLNRSSQAAFWYIRLISVIVLLPSITARGQTVLAESRFDGGGEGWWVIGDPASQLPTFLATGGNPSGRIRTVEDRAGVILYFVAPATFLGDRSDAYGGSLHFDLQRQGSSSGNHMADVVLLGGNGLRLVIDAGPDPALAPSWTGYDVTLTESAGWRLDHSAGPIPTYGQFAAVLRSLDSIQIIAEFSANVDTTSLDNVVISTAPVVCHCDANCDGSVNQFDIQPFIDSVIARVGCSPCAGDADGNGTTNAFDISPFLNCLVD